MSIWTFQLSAHLGVGLRHSVAEICSERDEGKQHPIRTGVKKSMNYFAASLFKTNPGQISLMRVTRTPFELQITRVHPNPCHWLQPITGMERQAVRCTMSMPYIYIVWKYQWGSSLRNILCPSSSPLWKKGRYESSCKHIIWAKLGTEKNDKSLVIKGAYFG